MSILPEIRALTWKEPFATLMLHGKIETRSWSTNYRGLVLICAAKKWYGVSRLWQISGYQLPNILNSLVRYGQLNEAASYKLGHAIGIGYLIDCRPMTPGDEKDCFVDYNPDLYCHIYEDVCKLRTPIPFKGSQRWTQVTGEMAKQAFADYLPLPF